MITGSVHVQVNPVVEPEDTSGAIGDQTRLLVTESNGTAIDVVKSDAQGAIDFTINTSAVAKLVQTSLNIKSLMLLRMRW